MAGLQGLVDDLATSLRRSVAIDDHALRLVVASKHFGDEDAARVRSVLNRVADTELIEHLRAAGAGQWTVPTYVEGDDVQVAEFTPRLCFPVRCNGMALGFLWIIDRDHDLSPDAISLASLAADRAGVSIYRETLDRERDRYRVERLLRDLVSSDSDARDRAVDEISSEQMFDSPAHGRSITFRVADDTAHLATSDVGTAIDMAMQDAQRQAPPRSALAMALTRSATFALALSRSPRDSVLSTVETAFCHRFHQLAGEGVRLVVGIGDEVRGLSNLHQSYWQSSMSARAAIAMPELGDRVEWGTLGSYRLLFVVPRSELARGLADDALSALDQADSTGELRRTLELFLDHAGDVKSTATMLNIHRATLYSRLARIEKVTRTHLGNGSDRLSLHLALKADRLIRAYDANPELFDS